MLALRERIRKKLCFTKEAFGRRVSGMEDTVGEGVCMGEIMGGPRRFWHGAWAGLSLTRYTGVRGIFRSSHYLGAVLLFFRRLLRLQQMIPLCSFIAYKIGSNPFLSTTSHPPALCSCFQRMFTSFSTRYATLLLASSW